MKHTLIILFILGNCLLLAFNIVIYDGSILSVFNIIINVVTFILIFQYLNKEK